MSICQVTDIPSKESPEGLTVLLQPSALQAPGQAQINRHRWYQRTAAQCNCANEAMYFPQEQTQQGTVRTWQRKGNAKLH